MPNAIRKLTDALTGTVDVPTAEAGAKAARQATIDAGAAVEAARAAQVTADESGDPAAIQKAEANLVAAEHAAERAARALQVAERRLDVALAAQAEANGAAGRKALIGFVTARDKAGVQIQVAIESLAAAVKAFEQIENSIVSLPTAVRGNDVVPGYNLGVGMMQAHLAEEIARRGILGQARHSDVQSLSAWIAVGSKTLLAGVDR